MEKMKFNARLAKARTVRSYKEDENKLAYINSLANDAIDVIKKVSKVDVKARVDLKTTNQFIVQEVKSRLESLGYHVKVNGEWKGETELKVCWDKATTRQCFEVRHGDSILFAGYDLINDNIHIQYLKLDGAYVDFFNLQSESGTLNSIRIVDTAGLGVHEYSQNHNYIIPITLDRQKNHNAICEMINRFSNRTLTMNCNDSYLTDMVSSIEEKLEYSDNGIVKYRGDFKLVPMLVDLMVGIDEFNKIIEE